MLAAERLQQDHRLAQAKKLLIEALEQSQSTIHGIKPPDPARKLDYDNWLDQFSKARGAPLWHPYIGSGSGKGPFVELLDGSIKYDLISGIGPHYFGHSHPLYLASVFEAALSDVIMQGNLQQNLDALKLMEILIQHSGFDHCFLSTTGVMANENALKIAFQKRYPANRILAFERCFMGRTIAASQITDKAFFREGIPTALFVDYIPFYDPAHPEESTQKAVNALKSHLHRYPKQHAAMCFELVQGEGGFNIGTKEFFITLMEILKDDGILVIVDEVQTFGRTSSLFAMQYFEVDHLTDIVTLGKLSQTCATLYRKHLAPKPGLLSQTFTSSTAAIRASIAIITELTSGSYYGPNGLVMQLQDKFHTLLHRISNRHPQALHGPFGIGAMVAFTAYGGAADKTTAIVKALFQAGIITFIAGSNPTRIRMLPPIGVLQDTDFAIIETLIEEVLLAHK
jgi:4-aminobutyrate aminotransferase-like enzyme